MTSTNHALTGVVIAASISNPVIGLPLAFLSHFALDALPHFGKHPKLHYTSRAFLVFLAIDLAVAASLLLTIPVLWPNAWLVPVVGGLLAVSPDTMWFPGYLRNLRGQAPKPLNLFSKVHLRIQWAELPWGYVFESIWFGGMLLVLVKITSIW